VGAIGVVVIALAVLVGIEAIKLLEPKAVGASGGGGAPSPSGRGSTSSSGAAIAGGGGMLSDTQVVAAAVQAGWNASQIPTLLRIIHAESGNCPNIYNGGSCGGAAPAGSSQAFGLTQIHPVNWCSLGNRLIGRCFTPADLADPVMNLKAALLLSSNGTDFSPWTASQANWG
jgi:hypothetical protein